MAAIAMFLLLIIKKAVVRIISLTLEISNKVLLDWFCKQNETSGGKHSVRFCWTNQGFLCKTYQIAPHFKASSTETNFTTHFIT